MKKFINSLVSLWQWWFTPKSTDSTIRYREQALRILLPIFVILRSLAVNNEYSNRVGVPSPYFPEWAAILSYTIPLSVSFILILNRKYEWAGASFLLHWYLTDMINLPIDGYWYPAFQISLIIEVILGVLLLPRKAILPFLAFQLITVGIWGNWLDVNHYDPPLLSSGQPVAVFRRTIITLAAQETIIMLIVRYLRFALENSLHIQQSIIEEVKVKNAELERFNYSISHELKSPLVTLKGFVGSINRDLDNTRYERIRGDLLRISNATDKMHETISDLLELSRIGRVLNEPETIPFGDIVQMAINIVDGQLKKYNAAVQTQPNLPAVQGDRQRLTEVLQNLLDNAVKYKGGGTPHIEIGLHGEMEGKPVFFVKDNGMGIAPEYHERIFGLFNKLDAASEGTGVGLALVKRIIEFHGGTIWVESQLGRGSTFYFTLPRGQHNS